MEHTIIVAPPRLSHYITRITRVMLLGLTVTFTSSLRKLRLKKTRQKEKGCEKQTRRQVLPVGVPEERLEKFILPLSFLLPPLLLCSFCPKFSSTSIFSLPSLCLLSSNPALPHLSPPVSLFVNTSLFLPPPLLCALLPHHPLTACHSVTLPRRSFFPTPSSLSPSPLALPSLPLLSAFPPLPHSACPPSCLLAVNVCDEEMLLCQNGGTCYQNQKCICPPEFKGVLCQHSRCEAGKDCNAASSPRLSAAALLLCTLLAHTLATLSPH